MDEVAVNFWEGRIRQAVQRHSLPLHKARTTPSSSDSYASVSVARQL